MMWHTYETTVLFWVSHHTEIIWQSTPSTFYTFIYGASHHHFYHIFLISHCFQTKKLHDKYLSINITDIQHSKTFTRRKKHWWNSVQLHVFNLSRPEFSSPNPEISAGKDSVLKSGILLYFVS